MKRLQVNILLGVICCVATLPVVRSLSSNQEVIKALNEPAPKPVTDETPQAPQNVENKERVRQPIRESRATKVVWLPEDEENAAHFVHACRTTDTAWAMCPNTLVGMQPWNLPQGDREEFARMMREATNEARLVRTAVLRKIHPQLPAAFEDFKNATFIIGPNVSARKPDKASQQIWQRWSQWQRTYKNQFRIPDGAL